MQAMARLILISTASGYKRWDVLAEAEAVLTLARSEGWR